MKPFCFPRLSKWEFEKATEYLHASTGPYINVGGTIATNLAYAFSRPIGDAPVRSFPFYRLFFPLSSTLRLHAVQLVCVRTRASLVTDLSFPQALLALLHSQRPVPLESFTLQVILATVRSTIYHHLRSGIQPLDNGDRPKLPYEARTLELYDPLHVLAHHTLNLDKGLVQGGINLENGQPEWYSQLMHSALFLCALCHHQRRLFLSDPAFSSSPARQTTYKFILAALTRLCEIYEKVVAQDERVKEPFDRFFGGVALKCFSLDQLSG